LFSSLRWNLSAAICGVVLLCTAVCVVGAVAVLISLEPLDAMVMQRSALLLAMGGAVVAVGTILALGIGRRLTARLQALESVAAQVAAHAEGHTVVLDAGATPPEALEALMSMRGDDEVASLARSIGAMMHALDERLATNAQLYAAAQARVRELSVLAEIARLLTAGLSLQETLDALGNHVCRLTGSSAVGILLTREGAGPSQLGGCGLPSGYRERTDAVLALPQEAVQGIATLEALRSGELSWNRIAETPTARADLRQLAERGGWGAVTAVPLRLQGRTVGVMSCYTVSDQPLPEPELRLLTTIADQVAVAAENARLEARARNHVAQEERARLARELHDSVSQAIYGIALGMRTALTLLERDPTRAAAPLEHALPLAEAALIEMRALIFDLRPDALEAEGLVMALEKQAAALRARHGLVVHLHAEAEPSASLAAKEALYRIAREALHNTVKHARAGVVDLTLHGHGDDLVLELHDDGLGFDPRHVPPEHLGLRKMRERAAQVGGSLEVESAMGLGTWIRVRVPALPASQDDSTPVTMTPSKG
jgi:signal transduction histidine kinase